MTTTITGNVGGTAEWNLGIVKLGGAVGATLATANSNTSTSSYTTSMTFNNTTSSQLKFAGLRYVNKVTGAYAIYTCLASTQYPSGWAWKLGSNGTIGSWQSYITATAKCPKSSYASSSAEYKALNLVWGTSC